MQTCSWFEIGKESLGSSSKKLGLIVNYAK